MRSGLLGFLGALSADEGGGYSHQYWRLYVTENNGASGYMIAIAELRLLDADGVNMATGVTAFASSDAGAPYTPGAAFDGDVSTRFLSGSGVALPCWLGCDLGAAATIAAYSVQVYGGGIWISRTPRSWVLQYSDDGSEWVDCHSVTDQTGWVSTEERVFSL